MEAIVWFADNSYVSLCLSYARLTCRQVSIDWIATSRLDQRSTWLGELSVCVLWCLTRGCNHAIWLCFLHLHLRLVLDFGFALISRAHIPNVFSWTQTNKPLRLRGPAIFSNLPRMQIFAPLHVDVVDVDLVSATSKIGAVQGETVFCFPASGFFMSANKVSVFQANANRRVDARIWHSYRAPSHSFVYLATSSPQSEVKSSEAS